MFCHDFAIASGLEPIKTWPMTDLTPGSNQDQQPSKADTCSNCGAPLSGQYCGECGQSRTSLNRPAQALAKDFLDGFFSLDELFWQTVIGLFRTPGLATRGFLDDRRHSFTPPIRIYVLSALVFVIGFQVSGITPLGLTSGNQSDLAIEQTEALAGLNVDPLSVYLTLFRPPWKPEPSPLSWEQVRAAAEALEADDDISGEPFPETEAEALERGGYIGLAVRIARDPAGVERQANLALNQAVLVMVIIFALLNLVLHPQARLITHVIHSLYIHAAALPVILASAVASIYAQSLHIGPSIALGVLGLISVLYLVWRADRKVYASSWWGASLRVFILFFCYAISFLFVAIGLILLIVL